MYSLNVPLIRPRAFSQCVNHLGTGRRVGGYLSAIEILNTVENHEWTIKKKKNEICLLKSKFEVICEQF